MFLGGYVSFALRGKFSQLDFNQFNFCRQRLCMGDLFFEQGIGLYILYNKMTKKNVQCGVWVNFVTPYPQRQGRHWPAFTRYFVGNKTSYT